MIFIQSAFTPSKSHPRVGYSSYICRCEINEYYNECKQKMDDTDGGSFDVIDVDGSAAVDGGAVYALCVGT